MPKTGVVPDAFSAETGSSLVLDLLLKFRANYAAAFVVVFS